MGGRRSSVMESLSKSPELFTVAGGVGALALLTTPLADARDSLTGNVVALAAPLALLVVEDCFRLDPDSKEEKQSVLYPVKKAVQKLGPKQIAVLQEQINVFLFAAAAAGLAGVRFGSADLVVLNGIGAFLNAFMQAIGDHFQACFEDRLEILDLFRGTFCGVFTSFAGLVYLSALDPRGPVPGLLYYIVSIAVGVVCTELGLRFGVSFSDEYVITHEERRSGRVRLALNWLPYGCAYIAFSSLLTTSTLHSKIQLLASYLFSFFGCLLGSLIAYSSDSLLQDFICNFAAVLLCGITTGACNARSFKLNKNVCTNMVRDEFEGSLTGALSTFCGASAAAHGLVVSAFPEEVVEELYFHPKMFASNLLKEIDPYLGKNQKELLKRHATRVLADFSLVICVIAMSKLKL